MFDSNYWYSKKDKKFLHNIDTFYYTVKLQESFCAESQNPAVLKLREVAEYYNGLPVDATDLAFNEFVFSRPVVYRRASFAGMYRFCLSVTDCYDLFFASNVPVSSSGECVTPEILVQIRSKLLWERGVKLAYDDSFRLVEAFVAHFGLHIKEIKENRTDFCWHTNYFKNPEKIFSAENIAASSMGYLGRNKEGARNIQTITEARSDCSYHVKYTAIGKRSSKMFLRIYLKTQEVVEEGYKPWFFYHWLFHGLINRFDLFCLEKAFQKSSFSYLQVARCIFIQENLLDQVTEADQLKLQQLLSADSYDYVALDKLASNYVPQVTKIYNIEYQVMHRASKDFVLLPLNRDKGVGVHERIYDFFDSRSLITDYLTSESFRMIKNDNVVRSRCSYTDFWNRLRNTKMVDAPTFKMLKLVRDHSSNIDLELRKTRAVRSISSYAIAATQFADSDIYEDATWLLSSLNDNDMEGLFEYKRKMLRKLPDPDTVRKVHHYRNLSLVDVTTGLIL